MKLKHWIMPVVLPLLAGCAGTAGKSPARGDQGIAVPVEAVSIPYDPNQPRYVVTVESLAMGTGPRTAPTPAVKQRYGWGPAGWGLLGPGANATAPAVPAPQTLSSDRIGQGVAAQLISALGNVGNIVVVDYAHYLKHEASPRALLRPGEMGPFIIKGTVTEFSEARRTGSVGLELQMVEPDSGRVAGVATSRGSFTAPSAGLFEGGESSFASGILVQATRATLNDAVRQLADQLRAKGATFDLPKPVAAPVPPPVTHPGKKHRRQRGDALDPVPGAATPVPPTSKTPDPKAVQAKPSTKQHWRRHHRRHY